MKYVTMLTQKNCRSIVDFVVFSISLYQKQLEFYFYIRFVLFFYLVYRYTHDNYNEFGNYSTNHIGG